MYKDHELFLQPTPETKIWRYLMEDRLFSLLEKEALFFSKASSFSDPFEGRYPLNYPKNEGASFNRGGFNRMRFNQGPNYFSDNVKNIVYICCFTINESESEPLWRAYIQNKKEHTTLETDQTIQGAAIKLTLSKLKSCFNDCPDEEIFIGKVGYLDYQFDSFNNEKANLFFPFLHKRVEYKSENELRAITTRVSQSRERIDNGVFIPISLQNLIEKIVLSPNASKDFEDRIISLCSKKGLENIVVRSALEMKPPW